MTSGTPLVSIIVPTFNRADFLPQTIESCLAQTYPNLEVIVVDDGSTDATAEVVARYGSKVIYVRQDRQGVRRARQHGLQRASGEYIAFLDSDDLILPTKIERQAQVLGERAEVGLCHGWYYTVDEQGRKLDFMTDIPESDVLAELICRCFIWSGAPLIRRTSLDTLDLSSTTWELEIYEWDLWLRLALAGHPFFCIREPLGVYRIHANTLSAQIEVVARRIFSILDALYNDPRTPEVAHTVKERAYATWHTWIAFRYYSACAWEMAQHHLTLALASADSPVARPSELALHIGYHAVNGRSPDPLRYLDDVFAHLPPNVEGVRAYQRQVRSDVHQTLALRLYRSGDCVAAGEHLARAIQLNPHLITQPDRFMDQLMYHAVHLSDDPAEVYINRVMQNLPPEADALRSLHVPMLERLGGWEYLQQARSDYAAGVFPAARAYFMHTLAREPALAANCKAFADTLAQQALGLPDPEGYARWVLANLPPSLAGMRACQSRVLGILSLKRAFDSYAMGQRAETLASALRAIRYQPSSITNRGVIAIIARSLLPGLR